MSVFRAGFYLLICAIKFPNLFLFILNNRRVVKIFNHSHFNYLGADTDGAGGTGTAGAPSSTATLVTSCTTLSLS